MCVHTYIYTSVVSSKGRNSITLSFLLSCKIIMPTINIHDPVTTLDRILLLRLLILKIMSWNLLTFVPGCFHVCCVFKMLFIANHRYQFLCHRNHVYSKFHDKIFFVKVQLHRFQDCMWSTQICLMPFLMHDHIFEVANLLATAQTQFFTKPEPPLDQHMLVFTGKCFPVKN